MTKPKLARKPTRKSGPLHDWSRYRGQTVYGWKNLSTGTICQNVLKESPAALYADAGVKVKDPTVPHKGFQAVPVRVDDAGILVEIVAA